MSRDRNRIGVVLKVRRIQEQQAAAEVARAQAAAREAELELAALRRHYVDNRTLDITEASVPGAIDIRQTRLFHAESIVRGRQAVAAAVEVVDSRRAELTERSMAVKGLERLDDRLADDQDTDRKRDEVRTADEHATTKGQRR